MPDSPDVTTPAAPAEGTSADPADIQSVADAFDAQALENAGTAPATEDGTGEGGAPTPIDPLDAFIQSNYQGDKAAFLNSLYESRAQGKRLADEVSELRGALLHQRTPPSDPEAEFKNRFESDPDVQAVNQTITTIDSRVQEIHLGQAKLGEEAATVSNDIARLEGQVVHADDIDKPKLLHELSVKKNRLSNIETKWETANSRLESLMERRADKMHQLQRLHRDIRDSMVSEQRSRENKQALQSSTRATFIKAFDVVARDYGLQPKTDAYNYYRETVRAQLVDYLDSLDDNTTEVFDAAGIRDTVSTLMAQAERVGAIKRNGLPKMSKPPTPRPTIMPRRPPVTAAEATSPSAPPARTSEDLFRDPDYIRRRADHIITTAGRRMQRR